MIRVFPFSLFITESCSPVIIDPHTDIRLAGGTHPWPYPCHCLPAPRAWPGGGTADTPCHHCPHTRHRRTPGHDTHWSGHSGYPCDWSYLAARILSDLERKFVILSCKIGNCCLPLIFCAILGAISLSVCLHLTFSEYTKGGGKDDMKDSKEEVIQRTVFMATIMRLLTTDVLTLLIGSSWPVGVGYLGYWYYIHNLWWGLILKSIPMSQPFILIFSMKKVRRLKFNWREIKFETWDI